MLKKPAAQLFTLPPEMDPSFDPAHPMTWGVKAATTGTQRQLDELILYNRYFSERTVLAYVAFVTFDSSSFFADKNKKNEPILMFKAGMTFDQFLASWDLLPDEISKWVMKGVYEVNPQYDPLNRPAPEVEDENGDEEEEETTETEEVSEEES